METGSRTIRELCPPEIRKLVRDKYSEVALNPKAKYRFRVGRDYALDLGYPPEALSRFPEAMAESFTGVSSYLARYGGFFPGDIVLELGAGAGLDTALLTEKVGPNGRVIGLDLSPLMAQKAARFLKGKGFSCGSYCQAQAEEIPLQDNSVDCVVSNGIFNLSPEKEKILNEIHRVLKPDGRVLCSEIVLQKDPTPAERLDQDDWFK